MLPSRKKSSLKVEAEANVHVSGQMGSYLYLSASGLPCHKMKVSLELIYRRSSRWIISISLDRYQGKFSIHWKFGENLDNNKLPLVIQCIEMELNPRVKAVLWIRDSK